MSIVELDGGDAKKMLDDLQDATGLAADVANGGAPSMDAAHELSKRLEQSKDLLAKAMVHEKMPEEQEPAAYLVRCTDTRCTVDPSVERQDPHEIEGYECGICGQTPEQMSIVPLHA